MEQLGGPRVRGPALHPTLPQSHLQCHFLQESQDTSPGVLSAGILTLTNQSLTINDCACLKSASSTSCARLGPCLLCSMLCPRTQ